MALQGLGAIIETNCVRSWQIQVHR